MKKAVPSILLALLLFPLLTAALPANDQPSQEDIEIQVSPHTILLSWKSQGPLRVTVHAEIDYSDVDTVTVELGGFEAISTYFDARGDLVAKFNYEEVKTLVEDGNTTLVLTGKMKDGTPFTGQDNVRVMD